jgi:glycosyltransferase involved in cell wall biosynthesis
MNVSPAPSPTLVPPRQQKAPRQSKTKRVLIVSFDFPPHRTAAVYRMTSFAGYLPQFGWQPTVLTTRIRAGDQEPELLEKLAPEVRVVRTPYLHVGGWENFAASAARGLGGLSSAPTASRQPRFDRYLRSLGELARSVVYFPDDTVGWLPYALRKAIQLHREEPFDAVFTTSPPRAAPVIGLLLKTLVDIPWVCEFMDPWYPPLGRIRRRSEDWLQSLLVRKANRVVVMVRQHAEELGQLFKIPAEKLAVVRNGFFEEDFASLETSQEELLPPGYVHLSLFGSIYPDSTGSFFSALAELLEESPELKERLRVNISGYPSESVIRLAREGELKGIVQIRGFIEDRKQVMRMMQASDCLLLFWGRPDFSRLAIPGKTYDYLRAGRPILAVTEEGGAKELIEEAQAGWVVPPGDTKAIKQALRELLRSHRQNGLPRPARPEFVAQFRWDRQAENLARVFDEVLSDGR